MTANVDRMIVGENAGLECKTASAYSADKWDNGQIPESYEIQCHHYMAVTGADAWYIACIILGKAFVWQRIERDEEIIRFLTNIEGDFGIIMFCPGSCRILTGVRPVMRSLKNITQNPAAFQAYRFMDLMTN